MRSGFTLGSNRQVLVLELQACGRNYTKAEEGVTWTEAKLRMVLSNVGFLWFEKRSSKVHVWFGFTLSVIQPTNYL